MNVFKQIFDLGFSQPKNSHLNDAWRDLLLTRKAQYPVCFYEGGVAPEVLDPQLIFGQNKFTTALQAYHYSPSLNKAYLPCLVGSTNRGVVAHDFASDVIHLLVSGQTGAGKTSGLYGILFSLMWLNLPRWLRIELFATKGVQMFKPLCNVYNDVELMKEGAQALIERLKKRMEALKSNPSLYTISLFNAQNKQEPLRYEVIILDEFANILRALEKEERDVFVKSIAQIASQGRSLGMHLVVIPQRPDAEGVPSAVKSQMTSSLTFRLRSQIDAKTADCYEATNLQRGQAVLNSGIGRGVLKMLPMEPSWAPFFCKRITETMRLNGYKTSFK